MEWLVVQEEGRDGDEVVVPVGVVEEGVVGGSVDDVGEWEQFEPFVVGGGSWLACPFGAEEGGEAVEEVLLASDGLQFEQGVLSQHP